MVHTTKNGRGPKNGSAAQPPLCIAGNTKFKLVRIMTREIELTKTAESMGTFTYCRQLSLSEMSDWKPIVQDFFSSRGSERGYYCPIWTQIVTLSSQFLQTFRGNLEKTCQEMIGSHLSSEFGWKTKAAQSGDTSSSKELKMWWRHVMSSRMSSAVYFLIYRSLSVSNQHLGLGLPQVMFFFDIFKSYDLCETFGPSYRRWWW